jgi:hypothetical protein
VIRSKRKGYWLNLLGEEEQEGEEVGRGQHKMQLEVIFSRKKRASDQLPYTPFPVFSPETSSQTDRRGTKPSRPPLYPPPPASHTPLLTRDTLLAGRMRSATRNPCPSGTITAPFHPAVPL